jgi:hypothetical protein
VHNVTMQDLDLEKALDFEELDALRNESSHWLGGRQHIQLSDATKQWMDHKKDLYRRGHLPTAVKKHMPLVSFVMWPIIIGIIILCVIYYVCHRRNKATTATPNGTASVVNNFPGATAPALPLPQIPPELMQLVPQNKQEAARHFLFPAKRT